MIDVVESILRAYGSTDAHSREKVIRYIDTLNSAGQRDTRVLAECGLAYLEELHEGPDRRYTGC